jgi:ATP-binding cassette subfamily C protein
MIARAIINRPRILFFDEATSALDNNSQAVVTSSLSNLKSTRIVIAHRLSTVIKADRIIVLQDGHIVQNGSYKELIAVPGLFQDLATRQIA